MLLDIRRGYTSKYYKGNASIMDQNSCGRLRHWRNASLLHATKDALFVLVTATSGTSVILFVVSNAVLTLLHLDISLRPRHCDLWNVGHTLRRQQRCPHSPPS